MSIYRGTTPTVFLIFPQEDVDFTLVHNVYVTFSSNLKSVTKSGEDLDVAANTISVWLTQRDTLGFQLDEVEVQANWTYDSGRRGCSTIEKIEIDRNLLMREVE